MPFTANSRGMKITGDETGDAAVAISQNFVELGNRIAKCNYVATTNPGVGNDNTQGYYPGSFWLNTVTGRMFQCTSSGTGAATWKQISADAAAEVLTIYQSRRSVSLAIEAASRNRVDFVGIGDSNQVHNADGWDYGWQIALRELFPMYGSGIMSAREGSGGSAGVGNGFSSIFGAGYMDGAAPSELADFYTGIFPANYAFGTTSSVSSYQIQITDAEFSPAAFRLSLTYGTFVTGTHNFTPFLRAAGTGFPILGTPNFTLVNCTTGSFGIAKVDIDVTADPSRTGGVDGFWYHPGYGAAVVESFFLDWRVTMPSRQNGFAYSTLAYYGGQSTRLPATAIKTASINALGQYYKRLRDDQGAKKRIIVVVDEGFNDRVDATTSVGPNLVASNTPAGFIDNHLAIVNRHFQVWDAKGWDRSELYWLFMPSHPVSEPDDAQLLSYRAAALDLMRQVPQSYVLDVRDLITADEIAANSWYYLGELEHLVPAAYAEIPRRGLRLILSDGVPIQATPTTSGLMSSADKAKLDGIASGATANPVVSLLKRMSVDFVSPASGGIYALTSTIAPVGLNITLPSAGTYRITADVRTDLKKGGSGTYIQAYTKLYDATASAYIVGSERVSADYSGNYNINYTHTEVIYTVTVPTIIQLHGGYAVDFTPANAYLLGDSTGDTILKTERLSS